MNKFIENMGKLNKAEFHEHVLTRKGPHSIHSKFISYENLMGMMRTMRHWSWPNIMKYGTWNYEDRYYPQEKR